MFKQLFTTIVRPHLEYAAAVWNPHLKRHIVAIENVQRRASKLIPGLRDLTYMERLRVLKLPTLAYRRYRGDMIEMFKITHGMYDKDVVEGFLDVQESRARGHPFNVYKRGLSKGLEVRKHSFRLRVTDQWNNLPSDVVMATNLNTFKNRIDKLWIGTDVYYNHEINIHEATSARKIRRAHLNTSVDVDHIDLRSEA